MSKWKCEICNSEFDNFQAQGFNHKIYCPLCYFKELNIRKDKEIERLKKKLDCDLQWAKKYDELFEENNRLKNIIDELEKWLEQEYAIVKANSIEEPNNPEWYIKLNERKHILDRIKELKEGKE